MHRIYQNLSFVDISVKEKSKQNPSMPKFSALCLYGSVKLILVQNPPLLAYV